MNTPRRLEIRNVEVSVEAKSHNPSVLNPDFLSRNRIVPQDWRLEGPPVALDPVAEVSYANGIMVRAQFTTLKVIEWIGPGVEGATGEPSGARAPGIVSRYVKVLEHVSYTAVEVTLRGHLEFATKPDVGRFVMEHFVKDGPWSTYGNSAPKLDLRFTHSTDLGEVTTTIGEAFWSPTPPAKNAIAPPSQAVPVLRLFSTFRRDVKASRPKESVEAITSYLEDWKELLRAYRAMARTTFAVTDGE